MLVSQNVEVPIQQAVFMLQLFCFVTAILSLSIFGFKIQVIRHPALDNIKGVL